MLYSIADKRSDLEYQSPLSATKDDTFANFRAFLEGEGLVEFPFDSWISSDKKRMLPRFERFNVVGEEVIVICKIEVESDCTKRRKVGNDRTVLSDSECGLTRIEDMPCCDGDMQPLPRGPPSDV
jgi:hypothetical protein